MGGVSTLTMARLLRIWPTDTSLFSPPTSQRDGPIARDVLVHPYLPSLAPSPRYFSHNDVFGHGMPCPIRSGTMQEHTYCTQCAFPGNRGTAYCGNCGMPRELTPKRRAGH